MPGIEDKMVKCPLKQYFRDRFWLPYIEKLQKKPIKYLTLYCPPAMDVRHFCRKGLIEFNDGVYKGAVGIAWDVAGYVRTANNLEGRMEKFKIGKISNFLRNGDKELIDSFPFDVINLDYCNHIVNNYVSDNLEDISRVTAMQKSKNCSQFVLFVTTRTDKNKSQVGFPVSFLKLLNNRINLNISRFKEFRDKYNKLFNGRNPNENEFLLIGIVKFVSSILAENGYLIQECSAGWIMRNIIKPGQPERDLLHLAFLVSLKKVKKIYRRTFYEYGGNVHLEPSAARILDQMLAKRVHILTEKDDEKKLEKIYGEYLTNLKETNFELSIPLPIEQK
ncbi:MAG TPA: hypothetical protein ACFYEK_12560 [Candidatus Wunengus sp. YC60]|uniref:hypothetical protein n=1 Tax=Candidatus Wunengus sp. YC60 TaxID=3367697 RepID=UPI00402746B1